MIFNLGSIVNVRWINGDIKKREWYRPFAPAVLFEHQRHVFDSDVYSPYMLVTTTVKEEWRSKLPAITHIDNSARHQSVTEKNNPKFYKLISSFYNINGHTFLYLVPSVLYKHIIN